VPDAFGVALVLSPDRSDRALAAIRVQTTDQPALPLADAALEQMRRSFPAARALPLLQALATASRGTTRDFVIDYLPDIRLAIEVSA
jgi:hypothetical protein